MEEGLGRYVLNVLALRHAIGLIVFHGDGEW